VKADISILELFFEAGLLVQGVMALLLVASLLSWTFIFQRIYAIRRARKGYKDFEQRFHMGTDLNKLYDYIATKKGGTDGLENIFRMGFREFIRLNKNEGVTPDIVMQNAERAMRVAFAEEEEHLEKHLPFLATVGSVSVYVGLFGTVWGIMTAFRALGTMQQATLAMVAPGISEALVATALGLFAAIPAVFAYNRFTQHVQTLLRKYDNILDEFSGLLQRQLYVRPHHKENLGDMG
jgi:biopolymer transport protein TolQ